jgi:hypothetical protein
VELMAEGGRLDIPSGVEVVRWPEGGDDGVLGFVRCPDTEEVTVGLDWSQSGVAPARGQPLASERVRIQAALERAQGEGGAVRDAPLAVELGPGGAALDWECYREAEATILALLQWERIPISAAVAAAVEVPRLALLFLKVMASTPGGLERFPLARYFRTQREPEGQEPFSAQVAALAGHVPDRELGRRRLSDAITLLAAAGECRLRAAANLELAGNRWRAWRRRIEYRPLGLPEPVPAQALDAVGFDLADPELAVPLRAYLVHVVRRRGLLPFAGVQRGCLVLATLFALVREHARALAVAAGRTQVGAAELREGITLVERTVAASPTVASHLVGANPLRRSLDRAMRRPVYAVSVVLPMAWGERK